MASLHFSDNTFQTGIDQNLHAKSMAPYYHFQHHQHSFEQHENVKRPFQHQDKHQLQLISNLATEIKQPPPSHLRDALVKEEDENSSDNVEKPPKRRKAKRDIIRPDPKYRGEKIDMLQEKANVTRQLFQMPP